MTPTGSGDVRWWPAPAKLNLFLHVIGRRDDGYHELQTVFQLIDRCDAIGVALRRDGRIERRSDFPGVPAEADLAVRAARALQAHTATEWGAELQVIKHIPLGGGLGGGSSDAATVLWALNELWHLGLDTEELARLGLGLGADVPLFIRGQNAWGEGRGEQLRPMRLPQRWFLVLHPGVAVATAEIFQAPELTRNSSLITIRDFAAGRTRNDCESVVCARYPAVAAAWRWLDEQARAAHAVISARMTGTGACVFAGFERAQDAQAIAERIPPEWTGFVARGLERSPLLR